MQIKTFRFGNVFGSIINSVGEKTHWHYFYKKRVTNQKLMIKYLLEKNIERFWFHDSYWLYQINAKY